MSLEIMMVAAEASSAHYALKLMDYWKSVGRNYHYFGVGSDAMEAGGFERFGKSEDMAVVGIVEIVSHYKLLKSVFDKLVEEALRRRPKIVIIMDYPDFNLKLAKILKSAGIKVFYYISPQVWAWRKNRIHKIREYCEKVYLLFPFEVNFYKDQNVPFEFVGHPLLDELKDDFFDKDKVSFQRERFGIKRSEKLLALMPGSRKGELDRHLDIQLAVARKLLKKYSELRLAILVAPSIKKEDMLARLENFGSPYLLLQDDPNRMISMADLVLVASGTATLMVGLLHKPMVIMYKVKWLTGIIIRAMMTGVNFYGLVNLISGREVVPERTQEQVSEDELFRLLDRFLADQKYCESVIGDLKKISGLLGEKGATARLATSLENYL